MPCRSHATSGAFYSFSSVLGLQCCDARSLDMTSKETLTVTTGPLPASVKVFRPGVLHPDIRVPMREIALHPHETTSCVCFRHFPFVPF